MKHLTRQFRVTGVERKDTRFSGFSRYESSDLRQVTLTTLGDAITGEVNSTIEIVITSPYFDMFAFDNIVHVSFTPEPLTFPELPPYGSLVDEARIAFDPAQGT